MISQLNRFSFLSRQQINRDSYNSIDHQKGNSNFQTFEKLLEIAFPWFCWNVRSSLDFTSVHLTSVKPRISVELRYSRLSFLQRVKDSQEGWLNFEFLQKRLDEDERIRGHGSWLVKERARAKNAWFIWLFLQLGGISLLGPRLLFQSKFSFSSAKKTVLFWLRSTDCSWFRSMLGRFEWYSADHMVYDGGSTWVLVPSR